MRRSSGILSYNRRSRDLALCSVHWRVARDIIFIPTESHSNSAFMLEDIMSISTPCHTANYGFYTGQEWRLQGARVRCSQIHHC